MKDRLRIVLACIFALFVSHSASHAQTQQKYIKDSPPETVRIIVENGKGEARIVFKWVGEKPAKPVNLNCKMTDAPGSFNTISAKNMSFAWEAELVSRVVEFVLAHPRWSSLRSFVSRGDSDRVRFVH